MTQTDQIDRRRLISLLVTGGGLAAAGVVGIPAVVTALSPVFRTERTPVWRTVGRVEEFPVGEVAEAHVQLRSEDWSKALGVLAVYVRRPDGEQVVVFSRNCTDLSCPVVYDPGSGCFFCPCHGGIFAQNGDPMAGPPKKPLFRYATRIHDGVLEIDLNSLPPMI